MRKDGVGCEEMDGVTVCKGGVGIGMGMVVVKGWSGGSVGGAYGVWEVGGKRVVEE